MKSKKIKSRGWFCTACLSTTNWGYFTTVCMIMRAKCNSIDLIIHYSEEFICLIGKMTKFIKLSRTENVSNWTVDFLMEISTVCNLLHQQYSIHTIDNNSREERTKILITKLQEFFHKIHLNFSHQELKYFSENNTSNNNSSLWSKFFISPHFLIGILLLSNIYAPNELRKFVFEHFFSLTIKSNNWLDENFDGKLNSLLSLLTHYFPLPLIEQLECKTPSSGTNREVFVDFARHSLTQTIHQDISKYSIQNFPEYFKKTRDLILSDASNLLPIFINLIRGDKSALSSSPSNLDDILHGILEAYFCDERSICCVKWLFEAVCERRDSFNISKLFEHFCSLFTDILIGSYYEKFDECSLFFCKISLFLHEISTMFPIEGRWLADKIRENLKGIIEENFIEII